jgi:hypothetical protein
VTFWQGEEPKTKANAELFADALTTIQKCDLLPSELLKQRDVAITFCENQIQYISKQFEKVENYSNEYSRLLGQKQAFQSVLILIKQNEQ